MENKTEKDYSSIAQEVEAVAETIWDMASNVWTFAELGFEEEKSSAYESKVLEDNGFTISDRGIGGIDTSWIATYGSGTPVIGILVEFDALPDLGNEPVATHTPRKDGVTNGHGCGHNLIGSGAIGAALALKAQMEKDNIPGTLKVFGCPAEELLSGKNFMAKAGAFNGLDVCLHWHPAMVNTVWNIKTTAASDFWFEWHGISAHAGATPWAGRSALQAAQLFLHGVDMMREHILPTARMHYIISEGGNAVNVVPDYAKVVFRYRGHSADDVRKNIEWVKDIAKGAALATQTKVDMTNLDAAYDLLPNETLSDLMMEHMHRLGPCEWTDEEQAFAKTMQKEVGVAEDGLATTISPDPKGAAFGASTEVGDVSYCVPTMGVIVSSWPLNIAPHHWGATASNGMSIGRKGAIKAAHILAATGLDLLTDAELRSAALAEFNERTGGKPYECLCEQDAPIGGHRPEHHEGHDQALMGISGMDDNNQKKEG